MRPNTLPRPSTRGRVPETRWYIDRDDSIVRDTAEKRLQIRGDTRIELTVRLDDEQPAFRTSVASDDFSHDCRGLVLSA